MALKKYLAILKLQSRSSRKNTEKIFLVVGDFFANQLTGLVGMSIRT